MYQKCLMKKTARVAAITKILSDNPNKPFALSYFCDLFGAAKSSISEDISSAKEILASLDLGFIQTNIGAGGGVIFIPHISDNAANDIQNDLCKRLREPERILTGGFLYTSDIMFDSSLMNSAAKIFSRKFQDVSADYVATIETKGIPVALMTAHLLGLPLVVIRRESKISEGSTLSINYFTGRNDRIQKISLSKRAVRPETSAIIIDDFMRAGGSIKGVSDILSEFNVKTVGCGVVISTSEPKKKKITDFFNIITLNSVSEEKRTVDVNPNPNIFN